MTSSLHLGLLLSYFHNGKSSVNLISVEFAELECF
jgi:hypothetical protein